MRFAPRVLALLSVLLVATASANAPDDLDTFVMDQMARRHIAGLSLAVMQNGDIVATRAYGVTDRDGNRPVTTNTLFQAGSISKSVAALGALHLVEQGKLALDTDVNATRSTWKLPSSQFTTTKSVRRPGQPAADLRRLSFVSTQDISARNIERHANKVAPMRYYRMLAGGEERLLLVYLTGDGLVTDVDVVDE